VNRIYLLLAILACLIILASILPGCDELVTEVTEITIAGHPTADFSSTPDSGCAPLTVTFQDLSDGPRTSWLWDFGDGETSTDTNPTHTYDSIGLFTVSLKIEDDPTDGEDTEVKNRFVVVGHSIDSFITSVDSGCAGLEVTFTPVNAGGITSWTWNFGDGSFSDTSDPTHIYDSVGIHQLWLAIESDCGSDTIYDTVQIVPCAEVLFYADAFSGCVPLTIQFRDTSIAPEGEAISEWLWSFDGGAADDSTLLDPLVQFDTAGIYEISLTVTIESGGAATLIDTVRVYDNTTAAFGALTDTSACFVPSRQFQVKFVSLSTGLVDSLLWDFGDGDTLYNDTTPVHAYDAPGKYSVQLIAYGCPVDTTAVFNYVVLSDSLTTSNISYTIMPDSGTTETNFLFQDNSTGVITSWIWDFGDGSNTGITASEEHQYTDTTGHIEVKLTIRNDCGEVTAVDTIIVTQP